MSSEHLNEYRCSCGKLLFRGLLAACVVEVKCKRCSAFFTSDTFTAEFVILESDAAGNITSVAGGNALLGKGDEYAAGKRLHDLYPLLRDGATEHSALAKSHERPYQIKDNVFLAHDGGEARTTSIILPRREHGAVVGYRIFNVLQNP